MRKLFFLILKSIFMKTMLLLYIPVLTLFVACNSASIKEPEYRDIKDVRIADISLLKTSADVSMVYYNPNNFGIQLNDATGDVYVENILLGHFNVRENVQVRKRREFIVPTRISLNNLNALTNYQDIWNQKEARIRIEGLARIKKSGWVREVPIRYEGIQNIEKLKKLIPVK